MTSLPLLKRHVDDMWAALLAQLDIFSDARLVVNNLRVNPCKCSSPSNAASQARKTMVTRSPTCVMSPHALLHDWCGFA